MVKGEISIARDFLTAGFDFFGDLRLCKSNLLGDACVPYWASKGTNAKVILDRLNVVFVKVINEIPNTRIIHIVLILVSGFQIGANSLSN
jgi:hypothetical protein